jgi:hypothetical protein
MKKINDGGPAFPQILGERYEPMSTEGMSLRDYFAAKAMQAMAVEYDMRPDIYDIVICEKAYRIADAMIEARKTKNNPE